MIRRQEEKHTTATYYYRNSTTDTEEKKRQQLLHTGNSIFLIIYFIDLIESSLPGISIVARLGSQLESIIDITGTFKERASWIAIISRF